MPEVTIRHSRLSDLDGISAVYAHESGYANTLQLPFPSDELWRKRLEGLDHNTKSLVAVRQGEVIGQLSLICQTIPRRKHVATLGMGVAAGEGGRGVGTLLMEAALDLADNWLNISRVELEVYADNKPALALYTKFGFRQEGYARGYAFRNGEYVDALFLVRFSGALLDLQNADDTSPGSKT